MHKLASFLDRMQTIAGIAAFAALTVIVSLQILTRFVTQNPFLWSEEVARLLLFWLVLNGAALAVNRSRHFLIELFHLPEPSSPRARLLVQLVPLIAIITSGLLMLYYGIEYANVGGLRILPISGVNMRYVYVAIPLSGALIAFYGLRHVVDVAADYRNRT